MKKLPKLAISIESRIAKLDKEISAMESGDVGYVEKYNERAELMRNKRTCAVNPNGDVMTPAEMMSGFY